MNITKANNETMNEVVTNNSNEMEKKEIEALKRPNYMNNVINFASVCGEEIVAQTATVDQQVVNDLFNAFMAIPQEVVVRFRNEDGYLKMIVIVNYREKYFSRYETFADAKLVENMIGAMRGDKIGALGNYKSEEHPLEAFNVDPRIDIFRQFIDSPFRCHFEADFVAGNGDRYVCATFNIGFHKHIKFCLKRTEEIEAIINKAIQAA